MSDALRDLRPPGAIPASEGGSRLARSQALAFRWRNLLAGAPLVFALLWPRGGYENDPLVWPLALALAAAGVALRAWSTQYCRYAQRDRKTLAAGGPYARIRNPLYVGNVLVIAAGIVASELLWLLPFAMAWSFAVYGQVVHHEERRLRAKYGSAYADYAAKVPRWIPRWSRAAPQRAAGTFLRAALAQSNGLLVLLPFLVKDWNPLHLWPGG